MLLKLEHLGIAIKDPDHSLAHWEKILGTSPYKMEEVPSEKVNTFFYQLGNVKIELLSPTDPQSVIHSYLEKKGEGIHHLAFEVEDIYVAMEHYKNLGFKLVNPEPKRGADNKLICFIHPKDTGGVLIELCQEIKEILD